MSIITKLSLKPVYIGLLISVLTACGGGSGDENNSEPTGSTNTPPTLTISPSSVTIEEGQSATVTVNADDTDSDSFSVSIETNLTGIEFDKSENTIEITAPSVDADKSGDVVVTATDSDGATTTRTLSVIYTNRPNTPPVLTWLHADEEPSYQMKERTILRLPFNVEDAEDDSLNYTTNFSIVQGMGDSALDFDTEVDESTGQLLISPHTLPEIFPLEFRGTFTVSDGFGEDVKTFLVRVTPNRVNLNISLQSALIIEGQTHELPFTITANDIDVFEFTSIDYANEEDAEADPLDFSIDKTAQTMTLSANSGTAGQTVNLRIGFQETESITYSTLLPVTIREDITPNEITLRAQIDSYREKFEMTNEYEYIAEYLVNILFARGELSTAEYQSKLKEIKDIRSVTVGLAKLKLSNIEDDLTNTAKYTDSAEFQVALDTLERELNFLRSPYNDIVNITNGLLDQFSYVNVGVETSQDINASTVSRFIGNSVYGRYVDGAWKFEPQFEYMEAPLGLLFGIKF